LAQGPEASPVVPDAALSAFDENLHDDHRVGFDNYKTKRSIQNVL